MNLFKKVLPLALSVALLTPALSTSADQLGEGNAVSQGETQTFEISGFSDSQPATEYELQKESTAIRHIPDALNTSSNQGLLGNLQLYRRLAH